ncbi:MAG: helix-turn-helix transcriptional regulator [Dehalococcoidia bacterium]
MNLSSDAMAAARRGEAELSERQREIMGLVVRGHTNGEIAEATGLSLATVKWHMSEILSKLGVTSRDEAADYWESRNALAGRAGRWVKALFALPAMKWTAGTAAALAVGATGLALWLSMGGPETRQGDEPIPPFSLTAVLRTAGGVETKVEWKYNDRRHWLIKQSGGDGITDVADGNRHLTGQSTYWSEQPLDGPQASGPFQSLLDGLGPRYEETIDQIVVGQSLQRWGQSSRIVGHEKLLGRDVTKIEFVGAGPSAPPGPPYSQHEELGLELELRTSHIWIDDETLFVLKYEYHVFDGVQTGEITRIEFKKHPERVFRAPMSPDATISSPGSDATGHLLGPPADRFGVQVPTGSYGMTTLPDGFELAGIAGPSPAGSPFQFVVTLLAVGAASPSASREPSIVLTAGPPASPVVSQDSVTLASGLAASLDNDIGGRLVLTFSDADVTVTIRGNRVTREELIAFANTLEKRP